MANAKKDDKRTQLEAHYTDEKGKSMTTNEGVRVAHDTETLKAGQRGPSLLQDFHHQEKMQHFDRERIPERVVHARGVGAHGTFTVTNDMSAYTSADFLRGEGKETPVFLRFSTVQGSKGSADTVRDPHGFAVKFYTQEGNFDIPGLTHAVFFIQDAIKFPDLIHSVISPAYSNCPCRSAPPNPLPTRRRLRRTRKKRPIPCAAGAYCAATKRVGSVLPMRRRAPSSRRFS